MCHRSCGASVCLLLISSILLVSAGCYTGSGPSRAAFQPLATPTKKQAEGVYNVRFRQSGTDVILTYDLVGKGQYDVDLRMSVSPRTPFNFTPVLVTGDVGSDIEPGYTKTITWRAGDELEGLEGETFLFLIEARRQRSYRREVLIVTAAVTAVGWAYFGFPHEPSEAPSGVIVIDIGDPEE